MTRATLAVTAALGMLSALTSGCAAGRDVGAKLANAGVPSHMPLLVACWEKEFEAAGFKGEYTATVAFVITEKGSQIRRAKVTRLDAKDGEQGRDTAPFRACIQDALNQTALPRTDDANGPGFATSSDLTVLNYVIAFVDASSKEREEAASRADHVLLGPRKDRCQGLYTYDPPREEVDLYTAIGQAEAVLDQLKGEPDQYARALQKAFDLRLELRDRIKLQLAAADLPDANRKRLRSALDETEAKARGLGAAIGCKLP